MYSPLTLHREEMESGGEAHVPPLSPSPQSSGEWGGLAGPSLTSLIRGQPGPNTIWLYRKSTVITSHFHRYFDRYRGILTDIMLFNERMLSSRLNLPCKECKVAPFPIPLSFIIRASVPGGLPTHLPATCENRPNAHFFRTLFSVSAYSYAWGMVVQA